LSCGVGTKGRKYLSRRIHRQTARFSSGGFIHAPEQEQSGDEKRPYRQDGRALASRKI
jgi:hypothetical protein